MIGWGGRILVVVLARFMACPDIWIDIGKFSWTMDAFWHQIAASLFNVEVAVFPFVGGRVVSVSSGFHATAPGGSRPFHIPHTLVGRRS